MSKLRVYSVSIMAFRQTDALELSIISNTNGGEVVTRVEQLPALIPAETIEEAAEIAKGHAFEKWKISEGWHSHQGAIMPVTSQFFELAFNAYAAGAIDENNTENPQCFNF